MSFVPVSTLGRASAATLLWRHRGRRHLTAIVKATFQLEPEARMTPVDPVPIAFGEHDDPYGLGLAVAGDVAPYLHQVDVTVVGHVELPPHFASDEVHVELELASAQQIFLDRQLVLDGSARVGPEQRHLHLQGMAPLSRNWPVRADLLLGHDPTRLLPPEMDVPYDLDWSFFQAAPREQRIDLDRLTGDEWLVLGGFFARRPRLRTALPGARGAARLYRRADPEPRAGEPFAMRLDMLHVDLDTFTCSLVWRGHLDAGDADPADLHVAAGVEPAGQPIAWEDPFLREAPRPSMPAERPSGPWEPSGAELGETVMLPASASPDPLLSPRS